MHFTRHNVVENQLTLLNYLNRQSEMSLKNLFNRLQNE